MLESGVETTADTYQPINRESKPGERITVMVNVRYEIDIVFDNR